MKRQMLSRLVGCVLSFLGSRETEKCTQIDDRNSAQNHLHQYWTYTELHAVAIQYTAASVAAATVPPNQIYFHWTHKLVPVDCCAELCLPRLCCLLCVFVVGFTSMVRYSNTSFVLTLFFLSSIHQIGIHRLKEYFCNCQLEWRFLDSKQPNVLISEKFHW